MKTVEPLLTTLAAVIVCLIPLPAQAETFEETRAKAEQGDAKAQFNLGARYDNGEAQAAARQFSNRIEILTIRPSSGRISVVLQLKI